MKLCKCGCGKEVKRRYVSGHNKSRKGQHLTSEQKQHLSEVNKGKVLSGETKRKIGEKSKGHRLSESSKQAISEKNSNENNGMFGKHHNDAVKQKIRESSLKMWQEKREALLVVFNAPEHKEKLRNNRLNQVFPLFDTRPERTLKKLLNELQIEFIQHHLVDLGEHSYQCDFYIPSMNLIIEADGIYWHKYPDLRPIDKLRNKLISMVGVKLLRIWEHEVDKLDVGLLSNILQTLDKTCLLGVPLTQPFMRFVSKYQIS